MTDRKKQLISYLENCPEIIDTLKICNDYGLPEYYLAGGAVTQFAMEQYTGQTEPGKC